MINLTLGIMRNFLDDKNDVDSLSETGSRVQKKVPQRRQIKN